MKSVCQQTEKLKIDFMHLNEQLAAAVDGETVESLSLNWPPAYAG
jgi:hypothetical protein